jgi:MFS transporter, PAT family, beta-lactamase induction signal transducer AmpG
MTQKRFSATQYALFTSLFALPRLLAGPIAGVAVDAMGWSTFFLSTLAIGVPGLLMLARFVPLGVREPVFTVEDVPPRPPLGRLQIAARGAVGALIAGTAGFVLDAALFAVKTMRESKGPFDLWAAMGRLASPASIADWLELVGVGAFAVISGLFVAALTAARRGAGRTLGDEEGQALA